MPNQLPFLGVNPPTMQGIMQLSQSIQKPDQRQREMEFQAAMQQAQQRRAQTQQMLMSGMNMLEARQVAKQKQDWLDAHPKKPPRPIPVPAGGRIVDPVTGATIATGPDKPTKDFIAPGILEGLKQFQDETEGQGRFLHSKKGEPEKRVPVGGWRDYWGKGKDSLYKIINEEMILQGAEPGPAASIARSAVSHRKRGTENYLAQAYADWKTTAAKRRPIDVSTVLGQPPPATPAQAGVPVQQQAPPPAPQAQPVAPQKPQMGEVIEIPDRGPYRVVGFDVDGEPMIERVR